MSFKGPVLIGLIAGCSLAAQTPPGEKLAFDVASVKPNRSTEMRGAGFRFLPGGRLRITNLPLYQIIAIAYDLPFLQSARLSGGPSWTRSDKYDIEATAAPDAIAAGTSAKARTDRTRLMLQALLADRFKLTIHRESKELPAYVVVASKNGPKLRPAKLQENDCPETVAEGELPCHVINGGMGRGLHGKAVTISDIALFVENWTDRPVIEKTGIQRLFELDTDGFAPLRPRPVAPGAEPTTEDIAIADPTRPTLFMIFDRLGLKMEQQRTPVEVFVIDNVEKPTEN